VDSRRYNVVRERKHRQKLQTCERTAYPTLVRRTEGVFFFYKKVCTSLKVCHCTMLGWPRRARTPSSISALQVS